MEKVASRAISKIKSLWSELSNKEVRDEYVSARISSDLAYQIFSLREQRGWTQNELGTRYGVANSQSRISRLEASCEGVSLSTLKKMASAFDVALSVKFVPFSQLAIETTSERLDRLVPEYSDDSIGAIKISLWATTGNFQTVRRHNMATARAVSPVVRTSSRSANKVFINAH